MNRPSKRYALLLILVISFVAPTLAGQTQAATDPEAAYTQTINDRAGKIVDGLGIADPNKALQVRAIVAGQYRNLRDIHDTRDEQIKVAKQQAEGDPKAAEWITKGIQTMAQAMQDKLHAQYLKKLSAALTPGQIEMVKDGMTYGVRQVTYNGYLAMLPNLTDKQKSQIMAYLVEAREIAMDSGSSGEKHAWFNKYKGKINNYLAAEDYDLKKASKEWSDRQKAAAEKQ